MSGPVRRRRQLLQVTGAVVAVAALLVGGAGSLRPAVTAAAAAGDPVVGAAGDVACDPTLTDPDPGGRDPGQCQQRRTADLLAAQPLAAVLALGDLQYGDGTLAKFQGAYDPSWGRVKAITRPAVGNHEYGIPGATGYFDYFGSAAGDRSAGWYSSDVGAWHLVALNANCDQVGCAAGSPQERWLRADLAAHPTSCTLAYFHQPRFTSSPRGGNPVLGPLWQAMYDGGVDLVLNGHEHNYERFAPQDPAGRADARGIREIIVGTGGRSISPIGPPTGNSEVRSTTGFGVLLVTLHAGSYDWRFASTGGAQVDAGSTACTSAAPSVTPPAPTAPAPTTPAPTTPAPTTPAPSLPAPTVPAPQPTTPRPTVPAPTQPAPTVPAPTVPSCVVPTTRTATAVSSAAGAVGVQVRGAAGRPVDLWAVTLPTSPAVRVRSAVLGGDGTASFSVRPVRSTRLWATTPGCAAGPAVTVAVRTGVSLSARRLGVRSYAFSGRTLPARPAGTLVTVRATAAGRGVAATARTAADGSWRVVLGFARGGRYAVTAGVVASPSNAAGTSTVRPTDVF